MNEHEAEVIRQAVDVKDVRRRRWVKIMGVLFLLFMTGLGTFVVTKVTTLQTAAEDATALAQKVNQACDQPGVTDPALAPYCPEAKQVVDDAPGDVKTVLVEGPRGPKGEDGQDGFDGFDGQDGQDGKNGTRGSTGQAGASGTDGANGTNGEAGVDGQNGSDGPPGPQGPQGETGATGATGEQGPKGETGSPGAANVIDQCDPAPEGQKIVDVGYSYDSASMTGSITCTYGPDEAETPPIVIDP